MVETSVPTCTKPMRLCWQWLLVALLALQTNLAHAENYRIDPKQAMSSFEVWMLGFIPIRGSFRHTAGMMKLDPANHSGSIEVVIDTTSITANSPRALAAARGPEFFNVEKYPRMEFKSSRFVFDGSHLRAIDGVLTLTGVPQQVTLAVNRADCTIAAGHEPAACRAEAMLKVKRSAFGMKAWSHSIDDDVTIRLAIVAFAETEDAKEQPIPAASAIDIDPAGKHP